MRFSSFYFYSCNVELNTFKQELKLLFQAVDFLNIYTISMDLNVLSYLHKLAIHRSHRHSLHDLFRYNTSAKYRAQLLSALHVFLAFNVWRSAAMTDAEWSWCANALLRGRKNKDSRSGSGSAGNSSHKMNFLSPFWNLLTSLLHHAALIVSRIASIVANT